jgi:Tol biopolymer transport system component
MNKKHSIVLILVWMALVSACQPKSYRLPALTSPDPTRTLTVAPSLTPAPTLATAPEDYSFSDLPGWIAHFDPSFEVECGGFICTYLSLIRPDFSEDRALTEPAYGMVSDIVWSPDGRYIAYVFIVLGEFGGSQLWVYDMQQEAATLLTPSFIDIPHGISWSADNRYLLFSNQNTSTGGWRLFKLDTSTADVTTLLDNPAFSEIFPAWSPTGDSITFSAQKDDGTHQIWSMTPDGFDIKSLSADISVLNLQPSWKSDGSSLAYYQQDKQGMTELWTMDFEGAHPRLQLELGLAELLEPPVWSPDGNYLVVTFGSEEKTRVLLLDLETKATLEVNRTEGKFTRVSWSPDSRAFIFMESTSSGSDYLNLFVLNDGNPFAVDAAVDLFMNPVWSPAVFTP